MRSLHLAVAICVSLPMLVLGERPTIFPLTTAQGLISNSGIFSIEQDSQGYLWIATHEGVSRFDGSEFRNYGTREGFDSPAQIQGILVRGNGEIWTAMNVAKYSPFANRSHLFQYPPGPHFLGQFLREDRQGRIWALANDGLYRSTDSIDATVFERVCLENQNPCREQGEFGDAFEMAKDQSLWMAGAKAGVIHRLKSGKLERFGAGEGLPFAVLSLMCDRDGRIWAGTSDGVFQFVDHPLPGRLSVESKWGKRNGFAGCAVHVLRQTRDGHVWAGGRCGLVEIDGSRTKRYSIADGLSQNVIESVLEDRDGELWLGTESAGMMRIERDGISGFGAEAGLEQDVIDGLFLARDGRVVVVSNRDARLLIRAGNEAGFKRILQPLSLQPTDLGVQHWQVVMQDHEGNWWVPGTNVIRIFAPSDNDASSPRKPTRVLGQRNGLPAGRIDCMLEDRNGDVWFGLYRTGKSTLFQWIRSTGRFRCWEGAPGVPTDSAPIALTETRSGSIWITYRNGGIGRYRDGKHILLLPTDKARGQAMLAIHEDDFGRLWTGRRRSVFYQIEAPDSDHPSLRQIPGISAPFLRCILSDHTGRLYLGSEAGLIQYDPRTGYVRHFHERDGLPSDVIQSGTRTRDGVLWFGTGRGLMRFQPRGFTAERSPQVWIDGLAIAGSPLAGLSDRGERAVTGLHMNEPGSSLHIGFHSINFHFDMRFQYRLTPGDQDWSPPGAERSVTYPRINAGKYEFAVRALQAGASPGQPATVAFEVLPPLWLRAWFIALVLIVTAVLFTILYRYRVMYLLQVERLRMRIAADLHDDLGASLTQIAVVSDQLRYDDHSNGNVNESLMRIADAAREMTSALGDVVWSIRPERDHLADLFSRMRRIGNDLCEAQGIDFWFTHPEKEDLSSVDRQIRRNVFLIFKESLRNAIRHGKCRRFRVTCDEQKRSLLFTFEDDGIGFDQQNVSLGQGLTSMTSRAKSMNGSLLIHSFRGEGTRIELLVPIRARLLTGISRLP